MVIKRVIFKCMWWLFLRIFLNATAVSFVMMCMAKSLLWVPGYNVNQLQSPVIPGGLNQIPTRNLCDVCRLMVKTRSWPDCLLLAHLRYQSYISRWYHMQQDVTYDMWIWANSRWTVHYLLFTIFNATLYHSLSVLMSVK